MKWRHWCEIKFRWRHGFWCQHSVMGPWEPIECGFYHLRQCVGCGIGQLR